MFFRKKHIAKKTDEEIIALYQIKQNNNYIGVLYERYYHIVFGVCLKYLKSIPESEDAVTLIFERLITDLRKTKVQKFGPWLYRVAVNHCLQQIRKRKLLTVDFNHLEEVLIASSQSELLEEQDKEELLQFLEAAILHLKPNQQKAISLFYIYKKSYEEVAMLTDSDLKKVKSNIQNGKRNLKLLLEKQYNQFIESNNG